MLYHGFSGCPILGVKSDLDEFVCLECGTQLVEDALVESMLPNDDDRLEMVGQAFQVAALFLCDAHTRLPVRDYRYSTGIPREL